MPSINKISYEGIEYDILGEELAEIEADTTSLKEDYTQSKRVFGSTNILGYAEVISGHYVNGTGALVASDSWNAYKYDLSKYLIDSISAWTNSAYYYAIAFYSSDDSFLSGIRFETSDSSLPVEIDNISIPQNASYAIVSNRKATSRSVEVKGALVGKYADLPERLDKISMMSVVDATTGAYDYGNYYIDENGDLHASASWMAYKIPATIYELTARTITNSNAFYAIAFYSSDTPSTTSFIKGIKYTSRDVFEENTIKVSSIPENTKLIIVATRTASSTEQSVEMTTLIDYNVLALESIVAEAGFASPFGKANVKAIYKRVPNSNDFAIIKDEIWFAENVYVDGVATDTTNIHRYRIANGNLVKLSDMVTDFGHWNVVDYCEENDCLIFGNGANSRDTEGNYFSVIPHPLTLSGTVNIEDVGFKCAVDIGFKVQAVWGDNNFGRYDIAYVFANNATTICVIQLLKDANGDFTGEFRTLETLASETSIGVGGADFWGDDLYIGDGGRYGLYKLSMTDLSAKHITKKYYYESGELYSGSTQGVHVDSDYIWIFSNVGGSSENYLIQYCR